MILLLITMAGMFGIGGLLFTFGAPLEVMVFSLLVYFLTAIIPMLLILVKTPAQTFLFSSLRGKPLLEARRQDKKLEFTPGDFGGGMASSKKYGMFLVDSDSVYHESKSGLPVLPVDPLVGITLDKNIIELMNGLKKQGIENIESAEKLNDFWYKCNNQIERKGRIESCGFEGVPLFKKEDEYDNDGNVVGQKYVVVGCPKCKAGPDMLEKAELNIKVPTGRAVGFNKISQYFKYNYNPHLIASTVERKVRDQIEKMRSPPSKWIGLGLAVVLIFLGAAIAYVVINNQSAQAVNTQCCTQLAELAKSTAKAVTSGGSNLVG